MSRMRIVLWLVDAERRRQKLSNLFNAAFRISNSSDAILAMFRTGYLHVGEWFIIIFIGAWRGVGFAFIVHCSDRIWWTNLILNLNFPFRFSLFSFSFRLEGRNHAGMHVNWGLGFQVDWNNVWICNNNTNFRLPHEFRAKWLLGNTIKLTNSSYLSYPLPPPILLCCGS